MFIRGPKQTLRSLVLELKKRGIGHINDNIVANLETIKVSNYATELWIVRLEIKCIVDTDNNLFDVPTMKILRFNLFDNVVSDKHLIVPRDYKKIIEYADTLKKKKVGVLIEQRI